jgi:hypothetical protein
MLKKPTLAVTIAARVLMSIGLSVILAPRVCVSAEDPAYEVKMISSGRNRPSIDLRQDDLVALCVALHARASLERFRQAHNLSSADLADRINRLQRAGLIRKTGSGQFLPTFMVVTASDARRYMGVSDDIVVGTIATIKAKLAELERHIKSLPGLSNAPRGLVNFFVFSDVLLDNWQIGSIEHDVMQAERPVRDDNAFYLALLERQSKQVEAFGIYGNAGGSLANQEINVYGRARYSGQSLLSATPSDFRRWFPSIAAMNDEDLERAIVAGAIQMARAGTDAGLSAETIAGFGHLGLVDQDGLSVLILSHATVDRLEDLAEIVRPDLERLLKDHLPRLQRVYTRSPYRSEVTFAEYAIWWYHFFYTEVTDSLAAQGLLAVPATGNVTYVIID